MIHLQYFFYILEAPRKIFDNFKLFFSTLFIYLFFFFETWPDKVGNSLYELPNHISKHQVRDDCKMGGVSIYIHNSSNFKSLMVKLNRLRIF